MAAEPPTPPSLPALTGRYPGRYRPFRLWRPLLAAALLGLTITGEARDGRFRAEYLETDNDEYLEWQQEFRQERVLEELAKELNQAIRIPEDITLSLAECGQENAFYDSEERRIILCYELMEGLYAGFSEEDEEEEAQDAMAGAAAFILFHEIGHALVHVLELPVTGREEDAVDQLAAFILNDGSEDGESSVLAAARYFGFDSEEETEEIDGSAFWGEHSMNAQRFYNILCWLYGANPEGQAYLVEEEYLPEGRAERCIDEWAQLDNAWSQLLGPHIKE
jgi:hypothetical protein